MEKILVSMIFMLAFLISNPLASAAEELHILSVSGTGTVESSPDRASISIGVSTYSKDAGDAQAQNARSAQAIVNSILALGIERKDIHTSNYNFYPTYKQNEKKRNEIDGYRVTNSVNVTVDDLSLVGKVIDAALSNGANEINSLDFTVKDQSSLRRQALQLAARSAREKADLIAKELGCRIVGVHRVNESVDRMYAPRMNKVMMMDMATAEAAETPVEGGTISLDARVSIDFIIE